MRKGKLFHNQGDWCVVCADLEQVGTWTPSAYDLPRWEVCADCWRVLREAERLVQLRELH